MSALGLGLNISPSLNWIASLAHVMPVTYEELVNFGYTFLFSTYPSIVAEVLASQDCARLFTRITPVEALKKLQRDARDTVAESIMRLVGVPAYQLREEQYSPKAAENLRTSDGFKP